jgi:hypothetical protein
LVFVLFFVFFFLSLFCFLFFVFLVGSVYLIFLVFCVVFYWWGPCCSSFKFSVLCFIGGVRNKTQHRKLKRWATRTSPIKHNTENLKDEQHGPHQ